MKRILIKETDRYYSKKSKGKYISEYLIYFKIDNKNVECQLAFGENEKLMIIHELILTHLNDYSREEVLSFIEEITLFNKK